MSSRAPQLTATFWLWLSVFSQLSFTLPSCFYYSNGWLHHRILHSFLPFLPFVGQIFIFELCVNYLYRLAFFFFFFLDFHYCQLSFCWNDTKLIRCQNEIELIWNCAKLLLVTHPLNAGFVLDIKKSSEIQINTIWMYSIVPWKR